MRKVRSGIETGDCVRARGWAWQVGHVAYHTDCEGLELTGIDRDIAGSARTVLYPFDRPTKVTRREEPRFVSRRGWIAAFRAMVGSTRALDGLTSAQSAQIDLLPYQLEPALAVASGQATRLLLADEVGLGKTIQAGLILSELQLRREADRVLILTPAGLCDQWQSELLTRLDIETTVVDGVTLRSLARSLPRHVNPWTLPGVRIASLDFAKRPEVWQGMRRVLWDLLIIDEAHRVATDSDRGTVAKLLGTRTRKMVLVTATPHSGDNRHFESLTEIGRLGQEESSPVVMFRRSRREVGLVGRRRVHLLAVRPTEAERDMHARLEQYIQRVWHRPTSDGARLAMSVLKKRALSSPWALAQSVATRLQLLREPAETIQPTLPFPIDDDDPADEPPGIVLAAYGLADGQEERRWLEDILKAARLAATAESKLAAVRRLVRRTRESLIVFTEYRDTLIRLASALEPITTVAIIHGGLDKTSRRSAERQFAGGQSRVLIATDAAGEGLNLQSKCRSVLNFELPWNPTRLEQRIGRVDRIGQMRPVNVVNLVTRDSAELRVLTQLASKIDQIRSALGYADSVVGKWPEELIAEAVVLDRADLLDRTGTSPVHSPFAETHPLPPILRHTTRLDLSTQAASECHRIRAIRALSRARSSAAGLLLSALKQRSPWVVVPRGGRPNRHALLVFRVSIVDGLATPVHVCCLALRVALNPTAFPSDRKMSALRTRELIAAIAHASRARVRDRESGTLEWLQPFYDTYANRAIARERALHASLAPDASPFQAGLFDRRAVLQHERDAIERAGLQEACTQRLERMRNGQALAMGPIELLLVRLQ